MHRDPHDRVSRYLERCDSSLLIPILIGREAQIGEQTIVTVDRGRPQGFGIDWDDPLAELAGRFSEELLEPGAKIGKAFGGEYCHLVAPTALASPEDRTEHHPGILDRRRACRT